MNCVVNAISCWKRETLPQAGGGISKLVSLSFFDGAQQIKREYKERNA